jgi:hypothetical protein
MKKIISLLLIALSVASFSATAEPKFRKGERLDIEEKAAPKAYYSGKYRLRGGARIAVNPEKKVSPKAYYSGKYRLRGGTRILLNQK